MNNTFHISSWEIFCKHNTKIQSLHFLFTRGCHLIFLHVQTFLIMILYFLEKKGFVLWYLTSSYFHVLGRKWNYLIGNFFLLIITFWTVFHICVVKITIIYMVYLYTLYKICILYTHIYIYLFIKRNHGCMKESSLYYGSWREIE